jgi:hypothetical protein
MRNVAWYFDGTKVDKKVNKKTKWRKKYPNSGNNNYVTLPNLMIVIYLK